MVGVIIQGTGESYRRIEPTNFLDCSLASIQIDLLDVESFDLLSANNFFPAVIFKRKDRRERLGQLTYMQQPAARL